MTATPRVKCEACGSRSVQRALGTGAGIIFKGSGFYETDYKGKGKGSGDGKPAPEHKSESKSESKPESKSKESPSSKPKSTEAA